MDFFLLIYPTAVQSSAERNGSLTVKGYNFLNQVFRRIFELSEMHP